MNNFNLRFNILASIMLIALWVVSGCSAESEKNTSPLYSTNFDNIPAAGTNGNGEVGGSNAGTVTPTYTVTTPVGSGAAAPLNQTGKVEDFEEDEVCAGQAVDPKPVEIEVPIEVPYEVQVPSPIAIYLMLDRSQSMTDAGKWVAAKDAINQFVNDPNSRFISVALQYFTLNDPACDGISYQTPAVAMGPLPDNADAISQSLAGVQLGAMTAIEPALRGMTAFCAQYKEQHPEEDCVGVFVSDGAPTQCSVDQNNLIGIARNAYDNPPYVKSFTVGMQGAAFDLLHRIAVAGGTDCTPEDATDFNACDVSGGMTLLQALEAIRKYITTLETKTEYRTEYEQRISECDWGIPPMPDSADQVFNPDKVNVVFSQPNQEDTYIGRVDGGQGRCTDKGGWYYDNPAAPTMIKACPQSCEYIKSVDGAIINIEYGCDTIIVLN